MGLAGSSGLGDDLRGLIESGERHRHEHHGGDDQAVELGHGARSSGSKRRRFDEEKICGGLAGRCDGRHGLICILPEPPLTRSAHGERDRNEDVRLHAAIGRRVSAPLNPPAVGDALCSAGELFLSHPRNNFAFRDGASGVYPNA